jgi:hypothetical protein
MSLSAFCFARYSWAAPGPKTAVSHHRLFGVATTAMGSAMDAYGHSVGPATEIYKYVYRDCLAWQQRQTKGLDAGKPQIEGESVTGETAAWRPCPLLGQSGRWVSPRKKPARRRLYLRRLVDRREPPDALASELPSSAATRFSSDFASSRSEAMNSATRRDSGLRVGV